MKDIINNLIKNKKTISTMESCTGGLIANSITNIEGSSEVFSFGAVTYSNYYKIKLGVSKEVIDKYSVYSINTAREMALSISNYTNSDYGIGITGKLNREDKNNLSGDDSTVYISIYNKENNTYKDKTIKVNKLTRKENKELVLDTVIKLFKTP